MEDTNKLIATRKDAREFVFSLIFAKAFAQDEDCDSFYQREIENTETVLGAQSDYIKKVFFGVCDNIADLDAKISAAAVGWNIARLSKTSITIMRLCIYEMTEIDDVPKRVALNEAVELAKKFDDDNAPAFVNGVLNNISRSLPDRECDKN